MTQSSSPWIKLLWLLPFAPVLIVPGLGVFGSLAIVLAVLVFVPDSRPLTLAMVDGSVARSLTLGIGGGIAISLFALLQDWGLSQIPGWEIDLSELDAIVGDWRLYLILLGAGVVIGGIVEELVFRGFIVGWGSALFGDRAAPWLVLLSAAVFGFAHMYQGPGGMLSTGVVGALIGFLYLKAGRKLLVAMSAHATINIVGITTLFLGFAP